ncbi:MAG: winged helix-turn-helix transcriptional regulator [Parvularculaceae bacterium]|nr:winged helix-turn-helix transcriptional regulator [Parvularculaceae bacterium]
MSSVDDIVILLERIGRVLHNDGHCEGLKPTQWEALRYFARANRFSRSPSALTAYLGVTKGTVSQTVSALEKKDLIEKTTGDADRRQVRIDVRAKGQKLLKRDPLDAMASALSSLPAGQRRQMKDDLSAFLQATLRRREGRPFGACRTCRYFNKNAPGGAPHKCGLLDEPLSAADSELICVEHERAA